eukprot:scaffold81381_cov57-Attheya_sp.AAC.2
MSSSHQATFMTAAAATRTATQSIIFPLMCVSLRGGEQQHISTESDTVATLWFSLPSALRFVVSGILGNMIFFAMEKRCYALLVRSLVDNGPPRILTRLLRDHKETVSFFVSYLLQIVAQHVLNAFLVFGLDTVRTREKYLSSLFACYSAYFTTLVASTICNAILLKIGVQRNVAFWGTIVMFSVVNFFLVSWAATNSSQSTKDGKSKGVAEIARGGGRMSPLDSDVPWMGGKLSLGEGTRWRGTTMTRPYEEKGLSSIVYAAGHHSICV